jgi:ribosomal protein S18 acetylase RimI-like enzyme
MAPAPDLARALAFIRSIDERASMRVEPFRFGTAYFHDRLPRKWSFNFLRVEAGAAELSGEGLLAEADRVQGGAGLDHRMLVFFDGSAGPELAPWLARAGWRVQPEVVMAFQGDANTVAGGSEAREVDASVVSPAREQTIRGYSDIRDEESVRQLLDAEEVIASVIQRRCFAFVVDGSAVSYCDVYSDGETAQIENVNTLPEFRGRGYAQAVLSKALSAVERSHELTFLLAHDDDWPKLLYERIGFRAIGLNHVIMLPDGA